jgi:tyrosyl-tRNA synthetase
MKEQQTQDPATWKFLTTGAVQVIDRANLEKRIAQGEHLRVKLGLDPTKPDIHIGHTVVLRALRRFQDFGHQAVLIIGDWTAQIGDPSGQDMERPRLSRAEVHRAAETYLDQAWKVLDQQQTEVRWQSEWFDKISLDEVTNLLSRVTVAQMLARDDFSKRHKEERPIHLQEFLYPLLQALDSVRVRADVELGGTDQTFNLLLGREIQAYYGQRRQDIMTFPILEGLDGRKMSKSLGNYIGVADLPQVMYRKVMAIPDDLILRYLELATSSSPVHVGLERAKLAEGENPRDVKARLAKRMVTEFHGAAKAERAAQHFKQATQDRLIPPETITRSITAGPRSVARLFLDASMVKSISEARRLISERGLRLNDQLVTSPDEVVTPQTGWTLRRGRNNAVDLFVLS